MGRQDSERKYFDNTCIVWDTTEEERNAPAKAPVCNTLETSKLPQ